MNKDSVNGNGINGCEVCGNQDLVEVLNLGLHPMCDDLVPVNDARVCKEYPIVILYCRKCFTAHQKFQIPKEELFPKSYHYRSRFTADVLRGMDDLVASCVKEFGSLKNKKVVDVGCNDGSLLDKFREKGAITFGIEPTGAYQDAADKGHTVMNNFLSVESAKIFISGNGKADFVTFTNVFAHIEDLVGLIEALKILCSPTTIVVIENHYLGAVLDGSQFDTFYHEHPRTYSFQSFIHIAKSLGLKLSHVGFPSRYGGNIRVFLGGNTGISTDQSEQIFARESEFLNQFNQLNQRIEVWKNAKKKFVAEYVERKGKLKAKAFPGRAAILVKLLGLSSGEIACVFEKPGSMKIGHYLPGTRIPIVSDDELFVNENKHILIFNLAWHIHDEIKKYLTTHEISGELVDILSPEDFKDKG